MISVILYGRNDSHGYNLHKRAAISLNCIAEVLDEPDDEILFVDYNTPNDLPTFIEAIYDTLTPAAKSRLRVLRVRPELHARMVPATHLVALEPHSRNIAIRRSNPGNRWVLFTNSDMIFIPRAGFSSLAGAVRDLPDGHYVAPRFELPEALWESFPRSDPKAVMQSCRELSARLHLEEIAVTYPYMRFDSPGDFQLAPRQALFDIHGFDERMIHGWHADSNMCKRLYLFFGGRTESLEERFRGYHCDHTRVSTLAHRQGAKLENDLDTFVWSVTDPIAPHQADSWGAPQERIEELDFSNDPAARFAQAVKQAAGAPQAQPYRSDCNDVRNFVYYPPERALPYLAANLTVYPRDARFAYAGNNPRMLELAARAVAGMGFQFPLYYVPSLLISGPAPASAAAISGAHALSEEAAYDDLLANFRLLIFDFGLHPGGLDVSRVARVTDWPREQRYSLGAVARSMENCAERCDRRARAGAGIPDFLVINAGHYVFRDFVGQFLLSTETPITTHVRKGRPRLDDERLPRSDSWKHTEDRLRSFFGYDSADHEPDAVQPAHAIDLTSSSTSSCYKDGHWGAMDSTGTWIEGYRASIVFAPARLECDLVAFVRVTECFVGPEGDPIRIRVLFEGEPLAHWSFYTRYDIRVCRVLLPARLMAGKTSCRLEFVAENPQSFERVARASGQQIVGSDPRELSIKVQRIAFDTVDHLTCPIGNEVDFRQGGSGVPNLDSSWALPDHAGAWTLGPEAGLDLALSQSSGAFLQAVFTIGDAAIDDHRPCLDVLVSLNGRGLARWSIGTRRPHQHTLLFPAALLTADRTARISFRIDPPVAPEPGRQPLGLLLSTLRIDAASLPKYQPGDVIDFTGGGNSLLFTHKYLDAEWSPSDRWGAWTRGAAAHLKISFEDTLTAGSPACFVISGCRPANASQPLPVRVSANGHPAGEWTLPPGNAPLKQAIDLPADFVAGTKDLILTFEIPGASAAASGESGDRPGFRLARAIIGARDIEMPRFEDPLAEPQGLAAKARSLLGLSRGVAKSVMEKFS